MDPSIAAREIYDLVIVGGGIYGTCMAMEAAQRGLRPLLVEREDFGGATSASSLRIVHGGLRYLQRMDIGRCLESARERAWFLRHFPDLVRPLPCVMPLDGRSYRRPGIFRNAIWFYERLTREINQGLEFPNAHVIERSELARILRVPAEPEYKAAAVWYDALMCNPQRLIMELLRWAIHCGAVAINYMQAEELVQRSGRITGVLARDRRTGSLFEFRCTTVVNCAGPWSRQLAAKWDREYASLYYPSVAFNVWLDVDPPCPGHALALPPRRRGCRTFFLVPQTRGVLVGTRHMTWQGDITSPIISEEDVYAFVADLNDAMPALQVRLDQVLRVHAGFLPARRPGSETQSSRPVFCDHAAMGGPTGLYSVSGVKYTTARLIAQEALERIFGRVTGLHRSGTARPEPLKVPAADDLLRCLPLGHELQIALQQLIDAESVVHLDDLLLRRTDWAEYPEVMDQLISVVWGACQWDEARRISERARLAIALRQSGSPWPTFAAERTSLGMQTRQSAKI